MVFCHTLTWISHGCTCVPHPEPPSPFPPHPILQGHPSAPTLSTLSHASNLDWWSVSHMIICFTYDIYMFQCYSLKSSHPHLQFSSVQSLSRVRLFAPPWIAAWQASLSITNFRSLLKLMPIESVMPSSHLILFHPLLLLPPIPPSIRVFSNESTLRMRWPKYWSFSFSISPSNEHPGLISFRMDWLDLLAVQGTLKSLLQHHSSLGVGFLNVEDLWRHWKQRGTDTVRTQNKCKWDDIELDNMGG